MTYLILQEVLELNTAKLALIRTPEGSYKVSGHKLFKSKKYLMIEQNTKEIKQEISIIKLNNPNHHKAVIPRIMSMKTFKTRVANLYLT